MRRPIPRLIKPLLTLTLITTLAGCCGCLPPPGMGGPGGGARAPGAAEAGGRWRDAPPPHWQGDHERPGSEGQQRPRPRRSEAQDGQDNQP